MAVVPAGELFHGSHKFYRCRAKGCQKYIVPHSYHPVLRSAWGRSSLPLKTQVKVLFGLVIGLTAAQCHLLWGVSDKLISEMSMRLDSARNAYVERHERKICFGAQDGGRTWVDVEADEVDLGKDVSPDDENKAVWEQWAGIVQRGRPESLVLFKNHTQNNQNALSRTRTHQKARLETYGQEVAEGSACLSSY